MTPDLSKPATSHTKAHNRNADNRSFNPADVERVRKGFIAKRDNGLITDEKGRFVVNSDNYEFLRDGRESPETVTLSCGDTPH